MILNVTVNSKERPTRVRARGLAPDRLSSRITDQLEKLIATEFAPGNLLPNEKELAARFQVSRIVIREAMKMLEDRGVVEVRAGRGTTVVSPTPEHVKGALFRLFRAGGIPTLQEMEGLLELRSVLEEKAAELSAKRAKPMELAEIEAALMGMRFGKNADDIYAADLRFHLAVARASGNRFFEMVLGPLTHVFLAQIKLTDQINVGVRDHGKIYAAIRRRDPEEAARAMRRLLNMTRSDMRRALMALKRS